MQLADENNRGEIDCLLFIVLLRGTAVIEDLFYRLGSEQIL